MSGRQLRIIMTVALLWIVSPNADAQTQYPIQLDNLEPISATNWQQIQEIALLGESNSGIAWWSEDGETLNFGTVTGVYLFDVNDPEHFTQRDHSPLDAAAYSPVSLEGIELGQPFAFSEAGDMSLTLLAVPTNERMAYLRVRDTTSGSLLADLIIDSPLVMWRYSADIVLPQFSSSGAVLYLRDGNLYAWDRQTSQEALLIHHEWTSPSDWFSDFRINRQGTYAAAYVITPSVSVPTTFVIFDLSTQPATAIYERAFPATDRWYSVAIHPNGHEISVGGNNGNVRTWTLTYPDGAFHDDRPPGELQEEGVVDLTYSPDGQYLAGVVNTIGGGYAFIRDVATGEQLARVSGRQQGRPTLLVSVAYMPSGDTVAFGAYDGSISVWNVADLLAADSPTIYDAPILIQAHTMPVADLNFDDSGEFLASAGFDGFVKMWSVSDFQLVRTYSASSDYVWSAPFSPDGQFIATSSEDGQIILWSRSDGSAHLLDTLVSASENHNSTVVNTVFNADGTLLAGSSANGAVYLWNVITGERITVQNPTSGSIYHLEFSLDGTLLAAASSDTTVRVWGIPAS